MRKLSMLLFAAALTSEAQPYAASVAALAASQTADIASSVGRHEINPILGTGRFGARQAGVKLAIFGGSMLAQRLLLRGHEHAEIERRRRALAKLNFAIAAGTGAVAARNWRNR